MDIIEELMLEDIENNLEDAESVDYLMKDLYIVDDYIDSVIEESCSSCSIFDTSDNTLFDVLSNLINIEDSDDVNDHSICKVVNKDDGFGPGWEITFVPTQFNFSDSEYVDIDPNATNNHPETSNYGTSTYDSTFNA